MQDMPDTCLLIVYLKDKRSYNFEAKTYVQGMEGELLFPF
jgi:hypothetical protein